MALRYVDARGVGRMDDLIFVYRPAAHEALFAVVVTGQQAYPLATDSATGALAPQGLPGGYYHDPAARQTAYPCLTSATEHTVHRRTFYLGWGTFRVHCATVSVLG